MAIRFLDAENMLAAQATNIVTTTNTALVIDASKFAEFKAVINVTACDRVTADETYVFTLEAYNGSAWVQIAALPTITAIGNYEIPISGQLVKQHMAVSTQLRLKATLAGTTPSITYQSWLCRV